MRRIVILWYTFLCFPSSASFLFFHKLFCPFSSCQGSGNIRCLRVHDLELSERQQTLIAPLLVLYRRDEKREKTCFAWFPSFTFKLERATGGEACLNGMNNSEHGRRTEHRQCNHSSWYLCLSLSHPNLTRRHWYDGVKWDVWYTEMTCFPLQLCFHIVCSFIWMLWEYRESSPPNYFSAVYNQKRQIRFCGHKKHNIHVKPVKWCWMFTI